MGRGAGRPTARTKRVSDIGSGKWWRSNTHALARRVADNVDLATHQGDTRHEGSPRSRLLSLGRGGGITSSGGWKGGNGFVRLGRQHIFSFATRAYPRHCSKSVMCLSSGLRSINGLEHGQPTTARCRMGLGGTEGASDEVFFVSSWSRVVCDGCVHPTWFSIIRAPATSRADTPGATHWG